MVLEVLAAKGRKPSPWSQSAKVEFASCCILGFGEAKVEPPCAHQTKFEEQIICASSQWHNENGCGGYG